MSTELNVQQESTVVVQDNKGTIECAEGVPARYLSRRKHMNIGHHFFMEMIKDGRLNLQ